MKNLFAITLINRRLAPNKLHSTMKTIQKISGFLLLLFLLSACTKDQCSLSRTFLKYTPVYMSMEDFRQSVQSEAARTLKNPGKIYFKDRLILINEFQKGIHVIDNTNPSAPVSVAFINIPGNVDMAMEGNMLYADSYMDLVVIDLSNPTLAQEVGRTQNVFDYPLYQFGVELNPDLGVVKEWVSEMVTEEYVGDCQSANRGAQGLNNWFPGIGGGDEIESNSFGSANGSGNGNKAMPSAGIAGSMARFSLYEDYLYAVTESDLLLFNISNPNQVLLSQTLNLGWGIETLFPYQDMLYVGSQNGMMIYDNSNPENPTYVSTYEHISSCDPVVVQNGVAYVTLRNGTECWGYTNQLEIVDVSEPRTPTLVAKHDMFNPHGLGIDRSTLFLCDGDAGLKVLDVSNPLVLGNLAQFNDIHAYDVIPLPNQSVLLMIGEDGFYQYDYTNPTDLQLVSVIPVIKE